MELALYHPEHGYYERALRIGKHGDFYTSVSVGPLFGELLAFQFTEWLSEIETQNSKLQTLHLIEAGAHDGRLAADILAWLQRQRPELFERIEYVIIEPSPRRKLWQQETLAEFAPRIRWLDSLPADSFSRLFTGIFFSNELLDAFPVHRLGWDAAKREWFEWGVAVEGDQLAWTRLPLTSDPQFHPPSAILDYRIGDVLPDGYTVELCPAAEAWWQHAAASLQCGRLLTFDYGFTEAELLTPARTRGTLRAYAEHRVTDDLLANPGEQDLTAHVSFSAIQRAGESTGLATEEFTLQTRFLTRIASRGMQPGSGFGEWTPERTRQFQTLTHPEHLGQSFCVLVQRR